MTQRAVSLAVFAAMLSSAPAAAGRQAPDAPAAARYLDQAGGVSLDEAVARALEEEPALRAARTGIDAAQGLRLQAGLRPNPRVGVQRRGASGGVERETGVEIQWPLDLFRRGARVAVADRELTAARHGVSDRERVLAADVRLRYGDVLAAVRDLATLDEVVSVTRRQLELLRARVDEGALPALDRDLLDVEVRRLESDRLLETARVETALAELKRVLGMQPGEPLALAGTLEDVVLRAPLPSAPPDGVLAAALDERADVREAEARIDTAEARIAQAEREGRVDVSLFASYMRMDTNPAPAGGLTRDPAHNVSGGAMLMVPLLNRNQGAVAAARAGRAGAAAAYDAARLAARTEVAAARARDEHARRAVEVYTGGALALARRNLDVVGQSYELGRVTVFDVLAERRRYLDVERDYTAALGAAHEARTTLRRALGEVR